MILERSAGWRVAVDGSESANVFAVCGRPVNLGWVDPLVGAP